MTQLLLDALLGGATAALKTGVSARRASCTRRWGSRPAQHLLPPLVEALIGWGARSWHRGNSATRLVP